MTRRYLHLLVLTVLFLSLLGDTAAQAGNWAERNDTPESGGLGEAVVGTGDYIYVARCMYATTTPSFWRYSPSTDSWTSMNNTSVSGAFRNGMAMAWDRDDHIYALFGGRYEDKGINNRTLFYRYSITNDVWEQLPNTTPQGAGDAITWSEHDDHIYALIGSNEHGRAFACYSNGSWKSLNFTGSDWTYTDDGASLVSVGEYLYALRGEYDEDTPNGDFARYNISADEWEDMSPILEGNSSGVGDGGSLLYIGDWMSEYEDCIFALGGGG